VLASSAVDRRFGRVLASSAVDRRFGRVLASSAVDRGFGSWLGQTKEYEIHVQRQMRKFSPISWRNDIRYVLDKHT
jgi:hypothetical protein